MPARKLHLTSLLHGLLAVLFLALAALPASGWLAHAGATGLNNRSWQLLNSAPDATTDYTLSFTVANTSTIGSLSILLCSNTPIEGDSCDLPAGMDVTNAVLTSQTGITNFSLFPAATNSMVLSRTPSVITAPLTVSLTFHNIINPTSAGSYYVRVGAYSSTNATGATIDYGGLAFAITNNLQISSVVPPYLTFCAALVINAFDCSSATGDYINFGDLSPSHSSQGDSQMVVATNAPNGYGIQASGTTMTSGNNIIAAISGGAAASHPGTSQFGINLRANSVPAVGADPAGPGSGQPTASYNNPNHYQFVSNDLIASSSFADDYRKYTVSYLVNVTGSQAPGVYASSVSYVCTGSF